MKDFAHRGRIMRSMGDDSMFEHGKVQPQAVELEEAVLGAILLESNACHRAIELLKSPEVFYKDQHRELFKSIMELYAENKPVDILTITEKCKTIGNLEAVGGAYYISQLTNRVSSSANMEYHIAVIQQKWLRREMIRAGSEMINNSFEDSDDVFDSMDSTIMNLMNLYNTLNTTSSSHVGEIAAENARIIRNMDQATLIGLPSGFVVVDAVTNGWQNGDFIVVAGRPGMGKTAFGVSMIYNMAVLLGIPIGFISLEMTKSQVVMRLQSIMLSVQYQELRGGRLSEDEKKRMDDDVITLISSKAYIDDTPSLTIIQLRAKVMDMVRNQKVKIVMIDYLQLMSGVNKRGQNREQEVSDISRGLKALAKELNIPIIAFSQLSRKVEDRGGDKKPKLSDLRESGAIEQDADLVMFLYRPEYYGIHEDDLGNDFTDIGIVLIEKHRNGSTGEFKLKFKKELMLYTNFQGDSKELPSNQMEITSFFDEKPKDDTPF